MENDNDRPTGNQDIIRPSMANRPVINNDVVAHRPFSPSQSLDDSVISPTASDETLSSPKTTPQDTLPTNDVQVGSFSSEQPPAPKKKLLKSLIIFAAFLVLLGGGASAYYFAYYLSPSVIWNQSLKNTSAGYNKLIDYADTQSKVKYSGSVVNGNLSVKSGNTTITGSISEQSDATNSTASFKTSFAGNNIDFEARGIGTKDQKTPDIYLQLSGIKSLGLGASRGLNEQQVDKLDGQWIVIDHSLIDSIQNQIKAQITANSAVSKPTLSHQDIIDAAREMGTIDSKYIFTSDKSKSVTTVIKNIGVETVDGHKTYHYKVGFVKQNVKDYITAIRDGMKQTALAKWATAETGSTIDNLMGYDALESSADTIKSTDTIDVWADINTRLPYKFRVSSTTNPSENYADFGLDYKKAGTYPFFVYFQSVQDTNKSTVKLVTTLNSNTYSLDSNFSWVNTNTSNPTSGLTLNADVSFKPSNATVKVSAPTNAISLKDAFSELGLGSVYDQALNSLSNGGSSPLSTGTNNPSAGAMNSIFQSL